MWARVSSRPLSRLNRAHPKKHDVSVLDFLNDADTIREAFADYYRATILADETDPNKLHDLPADLDRAQVYSEVWRDNQDEKRATIRMRIDVATEPRVA